ncbi:hypothetical protein BGP_3119 [Beggiatoa sp. PS]|nr:hypothetical protein BGP_3119 [Beggiatoa sp. PS]
MNKGFLEATINHPPFLRIVIGKIRGEHLKVVEKQQLLIFKLFSPIYRYK